MKKALSMTRKVLDLLCHPGEGRDPVRINAGPRPSPGRRQVMMFNVLSIKKCLLVVGLIAFFNTRLSAATYGTNFTDGSILAHQTITGANNIIAHQAKMDNGFSFADQNTTCSFNSYYSVGGGVNLNMGKLFLNRDFDTKNSFILGTSGHIVGNKHTLKLYERDHTFFMPYLGSFTLTSSFNTLGATNSVNMSYDNTFLATGAASNAGPEVRIFSVNSTSFTITSTRAAEFGSTVNSVNWHPTNYYLAAGGATGINIYQLNTSNGTLSTTHTFTFANAITAVAFSPDGNYLAFGGGTATTAFAVCQFANGLIGGTASPVTIPGSGPTISNNAISWKSTGDYVVIGVTSGNANSNKVQVYSFDTSTLALTTDSGFGAGVASNTDCLNVAWRSGQSEIAAGFNGALGGVTQNVRVFRHAAGSLTELTSSYVAQTKTVNTVRWNPLGDLLFVGTASGTGDEGNVYAYLDEDDALVKLSGVDFASNVQTAVWDEVDGHFLILGWADTHARMYKFTTQNMTLENVHIILDTDVQLQAPVRIRGLVEFHGNGNFLDFSDGYSIFVESGGSIEFINVWVKNYGTDGGQIFMADSTCQTEFVNSSVELASNVYTHSGMIVTEGPNTFILKNYDWNFDYAGSLKVEHASLMVDNAQHEGLSTAGKIRFGKYDGGSIGQYLDYDSGGTIKTLMSQEQSLVLAQAHSNALLALTRFNSNALLTLTRFNSNALLYGDRVSSNALLYGDRVSSNALLALTRVNSNALLYGDRVNSNALLYGNRVSSNALLALTRVSSNALLYGDRVNSNALLYGNRVSSNTLLALTRVSSNALLYGNRVSSNALLYGDRVSSNALLALTRFNSNALLYGDRVNSNALLALTRFNSNALLYGDRVSSNALLALTRFNSNALLTLTRFNSNALLYGDRVSSNALLALTRFNSNALLYGNRVSSNALLALTRVNSNALLYGDRVSSNALLALTRFNSNALLYGDHINSNASVFVQLTTGSISSNVTLTQNVWVAPGQTINITGNVTIDGQGAAIMFSHSDQPQFVVDPGVTVRLKDISLRCITNNTFDIGTGAIIELDQNVFFELCSDVAFMGETFNVLGDIDNPNVFTIRGYDAQRRFVIEPVYKQTPRGQKIVKTFNLGYATVNLENVEFTGVESVDVFRQEVPGEGIFVGTFAMANRSTINIDISTDVNIFVDGPDNALRFLFSDLTLSGFLDFSNEFDSELHVGFNLGEKLLNPPVFLLADDAFFLGSESGMARLIFDDYAVTMHLLGSNSFVTDNNAFLGGSLLEILRNPIKQFSNNLTIDARMEIFGNIDNPIDSSFIRSVRTVKRAKPVFNALTLLRQRHGAELEQKFDKKREQLEAIAAHKPVKPVVAKPAKKQGKKQKKRDPELELRALTPSRFFVRPDSFDLTIHNQMQLAAAAGAVEVSNGSIFDFGVSADAPLNLYLLGDTVVTQGAADVLLKAEDGIFVEGQNNIINVTKNFVFEGQLNMNAGASLIFEFDKLSESPAVIFKSTTYDALQLPTLSRLEFRGNGSVWFQDGLSIQLEGTTAFNKAILSVTESAALRLGSASDPAVVGSSLVTLSGTGNIIVDSGARIFVEGEQQLVVGSALTDDIDVLVDRGAIVSLSAEQQDAGAAALSFQLGTYRIDFQQKALLDVGKRGVFEINALNNVKKSGHLKSLSFAGGGSLALDHDGTFIIGQNALAQATKQEIPFTFDLLGGEITGDGMVKLAQTLFAGRIGNFSFRTVDLTAQSLVRSLINRIPLLTFATVFEDAHGDQWLFNKSVDLYQTRRYLLAQTIFKLLASDDIRQDDAATGNVQGYNNGVAFAILPDASRR